MAKISLNITIDSESNNTLEDLLTEKIKITNTQHIKAFSNKSQLIDYLIKLGLVQYKNARENDDTGTLL
ncbi:hypothetical protein GQ473_04905 [archaeon]|nr:hypothetical protein [archaeon]